VEAERKELDYLSNILLWLTGKTPSSGNNLNPLSTKTFKFTVNPKCGIMVNSILEDVLLTTDFWLFNGVVLVELKVF